MKVTAINNNTIQVFPSYPGYANLNAPLGGHVRYNPGMSNYEMYDGSVWVTLPTTFIDIGSEVTETLKWAREKMQTERELTELAKSHPTLAAAKDKADNALAELEVVKLLCKNYN